MEAFLDSETGRLLTGAIAMAAVLGLRGAWRWLGAYVRGTPTQLDDRMYAAVDKALKAQLSAAKVATLQKGKVK